MSFKTKIKKGSGQGKDTLNKLLKEMDVKDPHVKIGVFAGMHKPEKGEAPVNNAMIAAWNEFGAIIDHPGGTPYIILGDGRAQFVKKGTPNVAGITKPHTIVIPERSFLRKTFVEKKSFIKKLTENELKKIANKRSTVKKSLSLMGNVMSKKVKKTAIDLRSPENATSTKRKKGSSNPLVDTGQLVNSITYEVNVNGE